MLTYIFVDKFCVLVSKICVFSHIWQWHHAGRYQPRVHEQPGRHDGRGPDCSRALQAAHLQGEPSISAPDEMVSQRTHALLPFCAG